MGRLDGQIARVTSPNVAGGWWRHGPVLAVDPVRASALHGSTVMADIAYRQ